jgi:hypothetical protein
VALVSLDRVGGVRRSPLLSSFATGFLALAAKPAGRRP